MKIEKVLLTKSTILILILLILTPSFSQVKAGEIIPFTGTIKSISKDFKSIVIDNINIAISSDTKILDEKGNALKVNELRPELYVAIEALENPHVFLARRIVVKTFRGD
jgi:hypothetical protein